MSSTTIYSIYSEWLIRVSINSLPDLLNVLPEAGRRSSRSSCETIRQLFSRNGYFRRVCPCVIRQYWCGATVRLPHLPVQPKREGDCGCSPERHPTPETNALFSVSAACAFPWRRETSTKAGPLPSSAVPSIRESTTRAPHYAYFCVFDQYFGKSMFFQSLLRSMSAR